MKFSKKQKKNSLTKIENNYKLKKNPTIIYLYFLKKKFPPFIVSLNYFEDKTSARKKKKMRIEKNISFIENK